MTEDYLMKGRRRSMMLAVLLMLAVAAFAVPAKPGLTRLLTLTDGSTVHATLVGDEYLHYWLGADGNAYQDGGDGIYQSFDPQANSPTAVGEYTATITLTSAGADPETVQLTGMATKAQIITDETIDFTAQNYSNEQAVTNVSGTCCAVAFDKGTNTNSNAPKYYTSGTAIRMYGGNTMTIASETKTIVKIEITFGSSDGSNTITTDEATYSNGTWTGSASSVTFTIGGTSGNRRVQKVKITYDAPTLAYYQNADGKTGSALKTAMCGIIYNRTELGYDDLWTAYQTTDVRSDGKIWDMYSNITNYDPYTDPHSNSAEGSGFNREHSFPKSWFGGEVMPMYTDLHHLYPVDGNINTRRSNNPYGETNGETYKSANDFSKLGVCTYPGYTGTVFEPADKYKGDFARTYFYW